MAPPEYLFDTNAILEAVRTGTWNGLTGGLSIATVAECARECRRGDRLSSGYIEVSNADLHRLSKVHEATDVELAAVRRYPAIRPLSAPLHDRLARP